MHTEKGLKKLSNRLYDLIPEKLLDKILTFVVDQDPPFHKRFYGSPNEKLRWVVI